MTALARESDQRTRDTLLLEKARLMAHTADLAGRERSAHDALAQTLGGDDGDLATEVFEQELAAGLSAAVRTHIEDLNAALHRLDQGTYERCEECGEEISPERLRALPRARRCMPCQVKVERRARR